MTLSTAVGLTLQDHLDAWHAGEIGDIKVEVLAVMRDHEAMSGKAPTAVIAKNWILGVFTTQLDEDAARPGIFANWQGAITTARSDAYTDISGFTYTVLSEGSTLPFVGLRGDLSEIEGIVGANAFAHIDMAGEEDMHGTDGSDLRTQMGVNDILCFYGVPSHHVPCSRCT